MVYLDKELMKMKIRLRKQSKPGDDLWRVDWLNGNEAEGFTVHSQSKDGTFDIGYPIALIGHHKVVYAMYKSFNDYGEWEFLYQGTETV